MRSSSISFIVLLVAGASRGMALEPVTLSSPEGVAVRVMDGTRTVFAPIAGDASLWVYHPTGAASVTYTEARTEGRTLKLSGGEAVGIRLSESFRPVCAGLIERCVTVTASADQRYFLDLGWRVAAAGDFYSFTGRETENRRYSPSCSGPEFAEHSSQTFPFLGVHDGSVLYGVIGDTPGRWENRCFMEFDLTERRLSLRNGDGSKKRTIAIPAEVDATSVYRAAFDGWQHIEMGETQAWKTWIFASPAKSLYEIQLAAHLALANAQGFTGSAIEAILRNTSYLLLRRNLLRPESDYLFISGVGYGWKQWVTDGFYMSRGLDDPYYDSEARAAVFYERLHYEDNAQYYLLWSLIVKRAGGELDMRTVQRAYKFIRDHETDGLYMPPRLKPDQIILRTYMDQLPYEDGDPPSSNQGFHCGALMAAKELGFPVADDDIARAIAGYEKMFNREKGYMPTSLRQQEHVGQDALYGEVLTYAILGEKLLSDDMVRKHLETSVRIQSPHGMRIISLADGSLLEGHNGTYTYGGSWFLCDAANYLDGLIHGMDPNWVDDQLVWRLEKELAAMPAFHESLNTLTGAPYGHHLYSWNSGYWWLRREVRKRLGYSGPDPVETRMDEKLGVVKGDGFLFLEGK
ncbi:MAG: hypothetical protein HUU16_17695 [Candidatus Omnitrophica bacterium]|nr:hypothetical protein [Candidatus Omnitrophota bacterium]